MFGSLVPYQCGEAVVSGEDQMRAYLQRGISRFFISSKEKPKCLRDKI